ncbi:MAG TPA: hypothetical protein VEX68_12695 [Bryobacteraceae bacterium]|nr:hypothetical protein [Bryobacteraceae bacterium]
MRSARLLLFPVLVALPGLTADFAGPVSGYVFEKESGSIRPINGFPGGSLLGSPVDLPVILQSVVIRQAQNTAVGIVKESGAIVRITDITSTPEVSDHGGWLTKCNLVALSATGDFGVAYSSAESKLVRFMNSDLQSSIGTAEYGEISVVAVEGTAVLFGTRDSLYRWVDNGITLLGRFEDISSVAFLNGGRDVAVADRARNSLSMISDVSGSREVTLLANEKEGINKPAAVCLGRDNRLLVANADSTAVVLDASSRSILATIYLAAQPTRCEALNSNNLLLLNDVGPEPLVLVDLSEMASFFVPVNQQ